MVLRSSKKKNTLDDNFFHKYIVYCSTFLGHEKKKSIYFLSPNADDLVCSVMVKTQPCGLASSWFYIHKLWSIRAGKRLWVRVPPYYRSSILFLYFNLISFNFLLYSLIGSIPFCFCNSVNSDLYFLWISYFLTSLSSSVSILFYIKTNHAKLYKEVNLFVHST